MIQHAIVAFPRFEQAEQIEQIRKRLDPMARVLPAHVTLVFPFAAALTRQVLAAHVAHQLRGLEAFDFELEPPSAAPGGYVFLNVLRGATTLGQLHDRLYTGILAVHRSIDHVYAPHVTIGRLPNQSGATRGAEESARTLPASSRGFIDELTLFQLDGPLCGHVEMTFPLAVPRGA